MTLARWCCTASLPIFALGLACCRITPCRTRCALRANDFHILLCCRLFLITRSWEFGERGFSRATLNVFPRPLRRAMVLCCHRIHGSTVHLDPIRLGHTHAPKNFQQAYNFLRSPSHIVAFLWRRLRVRKTRSELSITCRKIIQNVAVFEDFSHCTVSYG